MARNYRCRYILQENTIIDTCHECQKIISLRKDLDCLNDSSEQNLKGEDNPNDAIIQNSLIHSLLEKQNDEELEEDQEQNVGSLRYLRILELNIYLVVTLEFPNMYVHTIR